MWFYLILGSNQVEERWVFCNQESWEVFYMDKRERSSTWRDC